MWCYVVKNLRDGSEVVVSLEEAARITMLDEAEIEWALEEYGICETDAFRIFDSFFVPCPLDVDDASEQ